MIWISKWKSEKEIWKEKHINIVTCLFPHPPCWPSYNTFKETKRNYKSGSQLGIYDMSFIFSQELELCYKLLHLGFVWMGEWKSGRVENCGGMKKWEDGKYLVFPLMCLVGEKNGRMKNVIYINWLLYPCYIICKK